MDILIGLLVASAILAGIMLFAKRFVKPVKGKLPDCCGPDGNRNVKI